MQCGRASKPRNAVVKHPRRDGCLVNGSVLGFVMHSNTTRLKPFPRPLYPFLFAPPPSCLTSSSSPEPPQLNRSPFASNPSSNIFPSTCLSSPLLSPHCGSPCSTRAFGVQIFLDQIDHLSIVQQEC